LRKYFLFAVPIILAISSCKKDPVQNTPSVSSRGVSPNEISGFVQKGPFSVGSTITLQELLPSLSPTGRVFVSQIKDNRGTFQLSNIFLTSSYVAIRADGFYFNEITGAQSASQITLNCLSDITNKSTINVNLISDLEKPRIEYLISQGVSFSVAKKQAEQEVLKIFNINNKINIPESELLDITHNSDDNAVLLAVSLILQGYRTEGELSNLLASVSYDISTDGVLTDSTLGTALINDAKYLHLDSIRNNINTRWNILGINDTIPDFEKYIHRFIDSTHYHFTNFITYPYSGIFGINLLNRTDSVYISGNLHQSIAAFLPRGATLRIVGQIGFYAGDGDGWDWLGTGYQTNIFASNRSGLIVYHGAIVATGHIYFYENGATVPTRVKNVYMQ
jgi:hypothetical protein